MTEHDDRHRDELPEELNASGYVGPYQFPDNSRRRIPGVLYLVIAALCVLVWFAGDDSLAWVNEGFLWAALALTLAGVISITSGWRMHVDETEALISAQRAVGFPVGHASAQQVWRGGGGRPPWGAAWFPPHGPPPARALGGVA